METIINQIIHGLMLGVMYSLVAVGFTLFFGVLNIIQFSQGEIFMVGAFVGLIIINLLTQIVGLNNPVILLVVIFIGSSILTAFISILFGRVTIRPILYAPPIIALLTTLAAGLSIRYSVMAFYPEGSEPKRFPALLPNWQTEINGVILRFDNLVIFVLGVLLIVATYLFINKTKLGIAMRAVAQDRETAAMMGVNINKVVDTTFMVGGVLAACAGIFNGLYYREIIFDMGALYGVVGFSAAVIGGLGNIFGAIVGGFLFALLASFTSAFIPGGSAYKFVVAFAFLIVFLVIMPRGILSARKEKMKR
ncbi:MAG: branched-chain amino acid ABC transporter permease [Spirochaetes bacterium]|mgnify:CR=1 FL=1|nr:MAG: branched-chain amino acid ABC transporter permease [Spirochaetota bacterium]